MAAYFHRRPHRQTLQSDFWHVFSNLLYCEKTHRKLYSVAAFWHSLCQMSWCESVPVTRHLDPLMSDSFCEFSKRCSL